MFGNLEACEAYLGSHRNTWESIGILRNLMEYLVTCWAGLPGQPYEYLELYMYISTSIRIPGNLEGWEAYLGSHRNI